MVFKPHQFQDNCPTSSDTRDGKRSSTSPAVCDGRLLCVWGELHRVQGGKGGRRIADSSDRAGSGTACKWDRKGNRGPDRDQYPSATRREPRLVAAWHRLPAGAESESAPERLD